MECLSQDLKVLQDQQKKCLRRQEGILNRLSALQSALPLQIQGARSGRDGETSQFEIYEAKVNQLEKQVKEKAREEHHLQKTMEEYENQIFQKYENVTEQMHCELGYIQETCANLDQTFHNVNEEFSRTWLSSPSKLKDCEKRIKEKFEESGRQLPTAKHLCHDKQAIGERNCDGKTMTPDDWDVNKYRQVKFPKQKYLPMDLLEDVWQQKQNPNDQTVLNKNFSKSDQGLNTLGLSVEQKMAEADCDSRRETLGQFSDVTTNHSSDSETDTDEDFYNISSTTDSDRSNTASPVQQASTTNSDHSNTASPVQQASTTDSHHSNTASPVQQASQKEVVSGCDYEMSKELLGASACLRSDNVAFVNNQIVTDVDRSNTITTVSSVHQTTTEVISNIEHGLFEQLGAFHDMRDLIQTQHMELLQAGIQPFDLHQDDINTRMQCWKLLLSNGLSTDHGNIEALMEVQKDMINPPLRVNSLDTVMILDISESMAGSLLDQMKKTVNNFLEGLAAVRNETNLQENVGLVTIGHETKLHYHFTSDHAKLRNCVAGLTAAGKTPLLMGLILALHLIKQKGHRTTIGSHIICPRIILITDGKINTDDVSQGPDVFEELDYQDQKEMTQSKIFNLSEKLQKYRHQVHAVGIGDYDKEFLTALSESTGGHLYAQDDIQKMCTFQQFQILVGRIHPGSMSTMKMDDWSQNTGKLILRTMDSRLTMSQMEEIIEMTKRAHALDQDHPIDINEDGSEHLNLPCIGHRVRRGPDWKGNLEDDIVGTITAHLSTNCLLVKWDNGHQGRCKYGMDGQYEVLVVDEPRILLDSELIEVGIRVRRGSDWHYGNQDGVPGSIGVVYKTKKCGQVNVRWSNGYRDIYNYGKNGHFDLEIVTEAVHEFTGEMSNKYPEQEQVSIPQKKAVQSEHTFNISDGQEKSEVVWQWLDESGQYRTYTPAIIKHIEGEYSTDPSGSVLLTVGRNTMSTSVRIIFSKMVQRDVSRDSVREVRRLPCTMGEYHHYLQEEINR